MGRPKSTAPKKRKLTLTVSDTSREQLTLLSEKTGISISQLVEKWTAEAIKKIEKEET